MKTINEYSQMLDQFIERSSMIDKLVVKSRQGADVKRELAELRTQQQEMSAKLEKLEVSRSNIWDNIGLGG